MDKYLKEYCVGCGLCKTVKKAELFEDKKGFYHPSTGDRKWLKKVCPSGGEQLSRYDTEHIWGKTEAVYQGWSAKDEVRKKASSGGCITTLAGMLLDKKIVDGVIHVKMNDKSPTETVACISYTSEEVIACCGSRYSISHPLSIIDELDFSKRYLFIGKPCDVVALKNYMSIDHKLTNTIPYVFSFFCAGLPSKDAQKALLRELGCDFSSCLDLRYRGNGWPGFATATDTNGNTYTMDYEKSWGQILGRDVMKACRFCMDGIGELADISCGDLWYLTEDGTPDFAESDGRNIIFARTKEGDQLIKQAIKEKYLTASEYDQIEDLNKIQFYQYDRRITMSPKILAMKLCLKPVPKYKPSILDKYAVNATPKRKEAIFKGTIKRVLKKKI